MLGCWARALIVFGCDVIGIQSIKITAIAIASNHKGACIRCHCQNWGICQRGGWYNTLWYILVIAYKHLGGIKSWLWLWTQHSYYVGQTGQTNITAIVWPYALCDQGVAVHLIMIYCFVFHVDLYYLRVTLVQCTCMYNVKLFKNYNNMVCETF